ncbi:DUF4280 domain-containing protein [Haliangium sp.]|uniref:DUF4280 domain-containing protein n=1 Tax=Haliangium sp. TaxID=2663208 RepID=UPI003D1019DA
MGIQVTTGAALLCSFGVAPSSLIVIPKVLYAGSLPAADITTNAPMANVPSFGACTSLSNPTVAAATSAALGVLTPQPCVPVLPAPWVPGNSKLLNSSMPTLDNSCTLNCAWGGVISITSPGQTTLIIS